jgi:flagellar protein FlaI
MLRSGDVVLKTSYVIPTIIEVRVDIIEGVDKKLKYYVREPPLSDAGRTFLNTFINKVYRDLNLMKRLTSHGFSTEAYNTVVDLMRDYVRKEIPSRLSNLLKRSPNTKIVSESEIPKIAYYVVRDLLGYGPIDPLVRDRQVEDITCNGVGLPVHVFHREFEWLETNVVFPDPDSLERVIRILAVKSGQEPSVANPIVEGVLRPEGYRVHIVLDTVSRRGHSFSIRRFREIPFTIVELLRRGVLEPGLAAILWIAVENKQGIVIYGPTGSGKTTLLNALAMFLPPEMKIMSAEDTPEVFLPFHNNWGSMTTRLSSEPRIQNVTLQAQIESAMRQRPDVLILGEIRSREAYAFFQGVTTGHGGLTTVHAESLEALIRRLTSPPMNVPKPNIATAKLYINILRIPMPNNIVRKVTYVYEVKEYDALRDTIRFKLISKWVRDGDTWLLDLRDSSLLKTIAELTLTTYEDVLTDLVRRATTLSYAAARNIDIFELNTLIRRYRKDPVKTFNEAKEFLGNPYELVNHELEEKIL